MQAQLKAIEQRKAERAARKELKNGKPKYDHEAQIKKDAQQAFEERQNALKETKIGPFSFDIDNDANTEILTSDQVYADLVQLNDIIGKT